MALITVVRSLNPWLARFDAHPGDFAIDRAIFNPGGPLLADELRFLLCRPLPDAGESNGWMMTSLAQGDLEQVERFTRPSSSFARPWLELHSSRPEPPALPGRRRWRRRA